MITYEQQVVGEVFGGRDNLDEVRIELLGSRGDLFQILGEREVVIAQHDSSVSLPQAIEVGAFQGLGGLQGKVDNLTSGVCRLDQYV